MQNTVNAGAYSFKVKNTQRPYSNDFTVVRIVRLVQRYKLAFPQQDEVHCVVQCTSTSKEPNMQYFCIFSGTGKLLACNN